MTAGPFDSGLLQDSTASDWREALKLYHATTSEAAAAILAGGFEDDEGYYGTETLHRAVWLSDGPLGVNEGVDGATLLVVELALSDEEIPDYEWIEEGKPYREFLIPAALINERGRATLAPAQD